MDITEVTSEIKNLELTVLLFLFLVTFSSRYLRVWMVDMSNFLEKTDKARSNIYFFGSFLVFFAEIATYIFTAQLAVNETTMPVAVVLAILFYFFIWTDFEYVEKYTNKVAGKKKLNKSSKYYYQQLDEVVKYSRVYRFMASNRLIAGHRPELRP